MFHQGLIALSAEIANCAEHVQFWHITTDTANWNVVAYR
ncbi:unnamed protein product, partial [marine sediment metagenome]